MSHPRDLFSVPAPGPYLLAHSVGCLPMCARTRLERGFLQPWADSGSDGWSDWLATIACFRKAVGNLIGAAPDHVCPQPGVSAALFTLLSGLPRKPGRDTLLASAHAFPSIGFAMKPFERLGYRLELLDGDPSDPERWRGAITPATAAVVAMHAHSNSGRLSPVAEIAASARACGALSIVDVAQSAGILPIDVDNWGADAVIGSCVKWLCGGPGAGFLWVAPDALETLEPLNAGWFSHADPMAFDIRHFTFAEDARRFWGGTPSIAPYALAIAGIETIAALGTGRILADNRRLVAIMADAAECELDMNGRGGTLCLTADERTDALAAALADAGCRFDRRGDILRLSFHAWNDESDAMLAGRAARGHALRLA